MTSLKSLLINDPKLIVTMVNAAPLVLELLEAVKNYRDVTSGNHYEDYDKMTDAHDALCKALEGWGG
jgi:hypothetical protein